MFSTPIYARFFGRPVSVTEPPVFFAPCNSFNAKTHATLPSEYPHYRRANLKPLEHRVFRFESPCWFRLLFEIRTLPHRLGEELASFRKNTISSPSEFTSIHKSQSHPPKKISSRDQLLHGFVDLNIALQHVGQEFRSPLRTWGSAPPSPDRFAALASRSQLRSTTDTPTPDSAPHQQSAKKTKALSRFRFVKNAFSSPLV